MPDCDICLNKAVQKHHISYFPEETMPVCDRCHRKIHSGFYPVLAKFLKYAPGEAKIFYDQKERISNFLYHLTNKKDI